MMPPGNKCEPDVAIVRGELEFDSGVMLRQSTCCMVVEINDTNLGSVNGPRSFRFMRRLESPLTGS